MLVLDLFLDILVALKDLGLLGFTDLESFVHVSLKFFLESVHLVQLLGHQCRLACKQLLVACDFPGLVLGLF